MEIGTFFGQSAAVQAGLGFGYLAYATAYAGLRDRHQAHDTVFITLAFGVPAMLAFYATAAFGWAAAVAAALVTALGLGMVWRMLGRGLWRSAMRLTRVHTDDGLASAWVSLIQTTRPISQIAVHLKDGQVFRSLDLRKHKSSHLGGLCLGNDGSVVMVLEIRDKNGERHEMPMVTDPEGRTLLTYIPADQIARVDIRVA